MDCRWAKHWLPPGKTRTVGINIPATRFMTLIVFVSLLFSLSQVNGGQVTSGYSPFSSMEEAPRLHKRTRCSHKEQHGSHNRAVSSGASRYLFYVAHCSDGPSAPTNLLAAVGSGSDVILTWSPSVPTSKVDHYEVWRTLNNDSTLVGNPTDTSFMDTVSGDPTTYHYQVRAVDQSAHVSNFSQAATPIVGAPIISVQPVDVTVTAPAPATFTVVATGDAPLTYQWQRNGTAIAGATGATYTLDPTAASDTGAQFDVVVNNTAGSVTSSAATLTESTVLLYDNFNDGDFAGWTIVDQGNASGPSVWSASTGALVQSSNIFGGSMTGSVLPKPGTHVWYEAGRGWTDYQVTLAMTSSDDDALGVMFRYQDANNYYRFSWDRQRSYRRLVKVVDGTFTLLAEEAVSFALNQTYTIRLQAEGAQLTGWVDGTEIFSVADSSQTTGTVGLYTWGNPGAKFDAVVVAGMNGSDVLGVTIPPVDVTVTTPNPATFTVGATGTPPLTYQWRRDGVNITGATSTTYSLASTAVADSGAQFDVVVSNPGGSVTSTAATLTVLSIPVAPTVTAHPEDVAVTAPAPATFSVTATGNAPLSYQWRRNGVDIPGATSQTYTLDPTAVGDTGSQFDVVVSNAVGSVTSQSATLMESTVLMYDDFNDGDFAGWTVVEQGTANGPAAWSASTGTLVQSSNIFGGSETGVELPKLGTHVWYEAGTGWTDYQLTLSMTSADNDALGVMFRYQDANNYYRFSWDSQRSYRRLVKVVDGTFTLLAEEAVSYVKHQTYTIQLQAEGSQLIGWVDGTEIFSVTDSSHTTGTVGLYSWGNAGSKFDGVLVAGRNGSDQLAITIPPVDVTATEPASATFRVGATGTPPLTYQWQRDGVYISGATSATYTLASTAVADSGAQFDVVVSNPGGNVISTAVTLTVLAPPTVTTQPVDVTVTAPASATFSVVATGDAPLSYQWRRDGVDIPGATSATYTLDPTAITDNGAQFDVVVSNAVGSITSTSAMLTESTVVLDTDFESGDLTGWTIVDQGTTNGPSAWSLNAGTLLQNSNIYGGSTSGSALPKPGTHIWYGAGTGWTDYQLTLTMRSSDNDALGVIFRYQDANNYYRFSWDRQRSYRRLVKVVNGTFTLLAQESVAYAVNQTYTIQLKAEGTQLTGWVDGTEIFSVSDSSHTTGTVGFYTWGNTGSRFDDLIVVE